MIRPISHTYRNSQHGHHRDSWTFARVQTVAIPSMARRKTLFAASPAAYTSNQLCSISYSEPGCPTPYVGPVKLDLIPGKGRGLVVTEDVRAGTLLLVCHPLCLIQGPAAIQLKPANLAFQITSHFSTQHQDQDRSLGANQSMIDACFDGTSETAAAMSLSLAALCSPECFEMEQIPRATQEIKAGNRTGMNSTGISSSSNSSGSSSSSTSSINTGSGGSGETVVPARGEIESAQRLLRLVELNCFGEDSGDFTAWHCRGEEQTAYLGLYPGLAMANHSCVPNSACLVLSGGEAIALRCATDLSCGEEVCISYLGGNTFSPLQRRRALLKKSYGFECSCARCLAEDAVSDVSSVMELLHAQLSTLKQEVNNALESGKASLLQAVQSKLLQLSVSVQAELVTLGDRQDSGDPAGEGKLRVMLHAGVGLCYELLSMVSDARSGDGDGGTYLAPQRLQLLQAVSPGSYGLCMLSARYWISMQASLGSEHVKTRQARDACLAAHVARYGEQGNEVMAALTTGHEAGQDELAEVIFEREAASRQKRRVGRWSSR